MNNPQLFDFRITLAHELLDDTEEKDQDSDDQCVNRLFNLRNHVTAIENQQQRHIIK